MAKNQLLWDVEETAIFKVDDMEGSADKKGSPLIMNKYQSGKFKDLQHLAEPLCPVESRTKLHSEKIQHLDDSEYSQNSAQDINKRNRAQSVNSFISQTKTFLSYQVRPGSMRGSVISLIACTLGAGTLTIPYVVSRNGLIGGPFWIILGALLTFYASRLLIKCGEVTGKNGYERLTKLVFGRKWRPVVSLCMMISLIGFAIAYMTLVNSQLMEDAFGKNNLPSWMRKNDIGGFFYSTIFTFCIVLPMSVARDLSSIRFTSALGVICSLLVTIVVVYEFFANNKIVPSVKDKIYSAELFVLKQDVIIETIPFMVFMYMYQSVLPQSYKELNRRSLNRMDRVVIRASMGMVLVYLLVGLFGYLTFADDVKGQLQNPNRSGNILECDYQGAAAIQYARLFILVAVVASTPFCFIPAKESYMQIIRLKEMTDKQNNMISVVLVVTTYILSIAIPNISDVITITGATVNPFIGFIFPIMFYLKLDPQPLYSFQKLFAIVVMMLIMLASFLGLHQYFSKK